MTLNLRARLLRTLRATRKRRATRLAALRAWGGGPRVGPAVQELKALDQLIAEVRRE